MKLTIGMASYNNYTEAWFTLQALRLYQDLSDTELLVIDNYGDTNLENYVSRWTQGQARYVKYVEKSGTAAPRDQIFKEAQGEWVLVIDSHVLLVPETIAKLKAWITTHPDCQDLLHGPLLYDDLCSKADAMNDEWNDYMWGTWRSSNVDPAAEAYSIPMHGMGLYCCRKDSWLGFHPEHVGFGGEEGYIHAKFRKAGRDVKCLPFLEWNHLFRVGLVPYALNMDDRVHNYVKGFEELGRDLAPVIRMFGPEIVSRFATPTPDITITRAMYHNLDVTATVREKVVNGSLLLSVRNDTFGPDPNPGVKKALMLEYVLNGKTDSCVIEENSYIRLPKSNHNRLGIFYTNNNVPQVIQVVLNQLSKVSSKADIITCPWYAIKDNPFPEVLAMATNATHLNINVQILQALYLARETGSYEYVSFLEHDVLYPEGYFDYPEFATGVLNNTNFMGVCPQGWQGQGWQEQKPLHQMIMRFDEAIAHFEMLMSHFIRKSTEYDVLEPKGPHTTWACVNPAVHINHGHSFTSHHDMYSKDTTEVNPYWGSYKDLGLF